MLFEQKFLLDSLLHHKIDRLQILNYLKQLLVFSKPLDVELFALVLS